jgi:hypothetical protein
MEEVIRQHSIETARKELKRRYPGVDNWHFSDDQLVEFALSDDIDIEIVRLVMDQFLLLGTKKEPPAGPEASRGDGC